MHVCRIVFGGNTLTVSDAASAAEKVPSLTWDNLRRLDFRSGKAPADLKKHDGAVVRVPGFIIPLEDNDQEVSEFLLVPYPLACIHVPAPPPNQIVHVKMDNGKKVRVRFLRAGVGTGTTEDPKRAEYVHRHIVLYVWAFDRTVPRTIGANDVVQDIIHFATRHLSTHSRSGRQLPRSATPRPTCTESLKSISSLKARRSRGIPYAHGRSDGLRA